MFFGNFVDQFAHLTLRHCRVSSNEHLVSFASPRVLEHPVSDRPELLRYDVPYRNHFFFSLSGTCYTVPARPSSPRLLMHTGSGFKDRIMKLSDRIPTCPASIRPCTVMNLYVMRACKLTAIITTLS